MKISIFWFRRDLRLFDNTALSKALKSSASVQPIFIFDEHILDELPVDDPRVNFIYDTLDEINEKLSKHGSSIDIRHGSVLDVWQDLIKSYSIHEVYINKDYEPYAKERDKAVEKILAQNNIKIKTYKDQVIFEEGEIVKSDGTPYTVYTPFKIKWMRQFSATSVDAISSINFKNFNQRSLPFPRKEYLGIKESPIKILPYNLSNLNSYAMNRDVPEKDNTSYLGPHLRFGTVSIRQIIEQVGDKCIEFINELVWREFFMQILHHFPRVVTENFKKKYDRIAWRNSETDFEKWCQGRTGYPLVDAGMRQLNATGYMHNRVRMITAGFLCKHLLIDWRWGEAYFAKRLLDYELSSNNGNWQWAAGTGCDAAPYFRIFNPYTQHKKFDPNNNYVKKWVAEYNTSNYPKSMVEHSFARKRALEAYEVVRD